MQNSLKGFFFGCAAAICYGMNPLGALHLYQAGLTPESVLLYRFALASVLLAGLMGINRISFRVNLRELKVLAILGFLFALCAYALFAAFLYMDAGLASTLLFLYPLEVAVIMGLFFKEKLSLVTALSILISLVGIALLYRGGEGGVALSTTGLLLVFISSLGYAIYIVVADKAKLQMGSVKLTFYAMLFCEIFMLIFAIGLGSGLPPVLPSAAAWGWALMLGFVPTVLSLVFMARAVKIVGSTPTAIMGALEPLTAVTIGVCVFGEVLTGRLVAGIILILFAVTFLVVGKSRHN